MAKPASPPRWRYQLGSLGSGNHFIEISLDEHGRVWMFLHSGSRGVGNKLAVTYITTALEQCNRRWTPFRTTTWPTSWKGAGVRCLHRGAELGAAFRLAQPRGDDGSRGARATSPTSYGVRADKDIGQVMREAAGPVSLEETLAAVVNVQGACLMAPRGLTRS
jgi:hypothetical protein